MTDPVGGLLLPIIQAEDPLSCVVMGTGAALDQMDLLRTIALN